MFKDKDRQREANRQAQAKFKAKAKGITKQGITSKGITEQKFIEEVSGIFDVPTGLKRGKDIKCFEDLPPDVQQTIRILSESNEEFQRRTGIAIRYQHLFPDRYHSSGL